VTSRQYIRTTPAVIQEISKLFKEFRKTIQEKSYIREKPKKKCGGIRSRFRHISIFASKP